MLRIAAEIRMWSREQVIETLTDALNVTVELDPPTDLRASVFERAVGMLAERHIQLEQVNIGGAALMVPPNGPRR